MWDGSPSTGRDCSILTDFCENCTIMGYNRIILYVKFYHVTSLSIFRHICHTKASIMFLYCWELAFGWPCNKIIENSRWSANQICQILSVEKDQGVCFYGFWQVKSINELFWQRNYARSIQRSTLARYSINEDVQFISIFQIKIFRRVLWFGYCFYSNGLDFDIRSRVICEAFIWGSHVIWESCRKIENSKSLILEDFIRLPYELFNLSCLYQINPLKSFLSFCVRSFGYLENEEVRTNFKIFSEVPGKVSR